MNFCVFFFGDKDGIWIHLNAYKDESPLEAAGPGKDKTNIMLASCPFSHIIHTSPWHTEGNFALWLPAVTNLKSKSYVQDCSPKSTKPHIQEPTAVIPLISISLSDSHCTEGLLWQCSCTYIKTCGYVKGSHRETSVAAARLRWCRHILVVQPLPDDFVHAGVGEEGLIKLIVAPLPVAQQVHDHVPAELALVLHSQSCGTDNFLRIIPVHMDNCTSNNFTCPGIQNRTGITPNPFQRKQTHTCSAETTDNPCEVNIIKTNPKKMLFVMRAGVRRGVLPERKCN